MANDDELAGSQRPSQPKRRRPPAPTAGRIDEVVQQIARESSASASVELANYLRLDPSATEEVRTALEDAIGRPLKEGLAELVDVGRTSVLLDLQLSRSSTKILIGVAVLGSLCTILGAVLGALLSA